MRAISSAVSRSSATAPARIETGFALNVPRCTIGIGPARIEQRHQLLAPADPPIGKPPPITFPTVVMSGSIP